MDTIKIENKGRTVYHFPVTDEQDTPQGPVVIERYRVVLGDSADAQLKTADPNNPKRIKLVPNAARVPENALTDGWEPSKTAIHMPAPEVTMTVEQFAEEVFPRGSVARGVIDSLIAEGTVRFEESRTGALGRYEDKLAKAAAEG